MSLFDFFYNRYLTNPGTWIGLAIFSSIVIALVWFAKRSRRSRVSTGRPPSLAARIAETTALIGISVIILTIFTDFSDKSGLWRTYLMPPVSSTDCTIMIALLSFLVIAWLVLAWFRHTAWTCIALPLFFITLSFAFHATDILTHKKYCHEILATPVPIEITLNDNIPGADVWFNGVYLGKTPIHITDKELFKKVPKLTEPPEAWNDSKKYHHDIDGKESRPLSRINLTPPTRIAYHQDEPKQLDFYARVELNGQKMYRGWYCVSESAGSRMRGNIQPGHIKLGMFLPRWEKEVDQLLQRLRFNNYQVDDAWIAAAESYEPHVWQTMRRLSKNEPELNQAIDAWVTRRYKLDGVRGPESANDVFNHIVTETEKQLLFNSDSPAGRAIELLVPYLDVKSFVNQTEAMLDSFPKHCEGPVPYNSFYPSGQFSTTLYPEHSHLKILTETIVSLYATWKLDERLDRQDNQQDNLIEQRIVPALLRHNYNGNSNTFTMAKNLGGSIYEQFVLRHIHGETHFNPNLHGYNPYSNCPWGGWKDNWWFLTFSIDSEAGQAFRQKYANDLLKISREIVAKQDHLWPAPDSHIGYLFRDLPNHQECLAVQFWPDFNQLAYGKNGQDPEGAQIRWAYLAEIQKYTKPKMFVDVYRRFADKNRIIQGNVDKCVLTKLEPDLQRKVLETLLKEAKKSLKEKKSDDIILATHRANYDDFLQLKHLIPSEQSAAEMLDWINEDPKEQEQRIKRVKRMAKRDLLSIHHLRKLAEAKDPKLRRLAFAPIRKSPTTERRELLQKLLKDPDKQIRAEAEKLDQKLKALPNQPLPVQK